MKAPRDEGGPVDREAWLCGIVDGIASSRGAEVVAEALGREVVAHASRPTSTALVIALVADLHASGALLGEIGQHLLRRGLLLDTEEGAKGLWKTLALCRGVDLTERLWWRPDLLYMSLVELWASEARRAASSPTVADLLERLWRIDPDSAVAWSSDPAPLETLADFEARSRTSSLIIDRYLASPDVDEARQSAAEALAAGALANGDLVGFTEWRGVWSHATRVLLELQQSTEFVELANALAPFVEDLGALLRAHVDRFTMMEITLLQRGSPDARLMEEHVAMIPQRYVMSSYGGAVMANGLPDRVEDMTLCPDWLADEVYSGGSRSGYESNGGTAYLWLALEPHEEFAEAAPDTIGLGLLADTRYPIELVLTLGSAPDAPYISYPMGHTDNTREFLALMLLTGRLIVDLFRIDPEDGLVLLRRSGVVADALIEATRDRIMDALRTAPPASRFSTAGMLEGHIIGGFLASENAKSELLLSLDPSPAGPGAERLASERSAYLDAEVTRVRRLLAGVDTAAAEDRVAEARTALGDAWGTFQTRRRDRREPALDPIVELQECVAGIATTRRAVVHFNLQAGHLQGYWVADGGAERGWMSGESVDLGAIRTAVRPWLEQERGDVDALVRAASPLALELVDALDPLGIEEVVVIPWAAIQGVPFGALEVGDRRLGEIMDISYAPSVGILRLAERVAPPRTAPALVAAHGGTLPWADPEVTAVGRLYGVAPSLGGGRNDVVDALQRGRVVHVASHGQWWREDHFASVLDVCEGGAIDRYISAAEMHRDLDVRGMELVVLSACDTGRAPVDRRGIEGYTGIDAAFLVGGAKAVVSNMWRVPDLAAMVFSVEMHARLIAGDSVATAFQSGLAALRSGGSALDPRAIEALDHAADGWRDRCSAHRATLAQPATWATFKLSGAHWSARPLDGESAD